MPAAARAHRSAPTSPPAAPACAACGGRLVEGPPLAGYPLFDCAACGHRMTVPEDRQRHVAAVYGDDYFFGGGAGYPGYLDEGRLLAARGRWYGRRLTRLLGRRGVVLDVGAAAGFTLAGLAEAGWRGFGVEPNPAMAAFARERLGVEVVTGTLEEAVFPAARQVDVVCLLQVLEHLIDPYAALARATGRLAAGGGVLVETWNRESATARLLGRRWPQYSPPSVLHWFSRASLAALMARLGLALRARGRPRKRIGARHAASLLAAKAGDRRLAAALARLARLLPPGATIPYPLDDVEWHLFVRPAGS